MLDMVFNPKWTTLKKLIWLKAAILSGVASVIRTVTGNAPITLTNAVNKAIRSLTQTGLCTQDDTPTPSAPVPTKCNNGALTMVDDELPSGYKRVKGFSVDDDCYWKFTGFNLNGSDTLRFSFSVTAACNVIGSYSGSSSGNNYSLYVAISGTGKYLRYKDGAYNSVVDTNTRYDVVITPTGSIGMKTDSTWDDLSFTTTTDFCVGTTSTSTTSAKLKGSLYGNVIVDGRMTLVPCERISDNVLGYYDLVGEAFYEPTAGTPTSLGYDGSHYNLQTVGTAEVLTLGGKNLNGGTIEHIGFTSTGSSSTSETFAGTGTIIPCVAGEKYTVSFGGFTTSGISGVFVNTWKTDGTFNLRQAISSSGETTFTIPDGVNKVNFTLYKTGGATIDSTSWMQVERGASATPYEPYVEPQTASVPMLLSVGDYADEAEIISGGVTHMIGINVLDGTEEWTTDTYGGYRRMVLQEVLNASGDTLSVLCSHYVSRAADARQQPNSIFIASTGKLVIYVDSTQNFSTGEEFNTWLAAQYAAGTPVIIVYPLAEATTESVAGQALHTVAGTNIVSVTAEVSPVALSCEYYATE